MMADRALCGAKTRDGDPCRAWPLKGHTRCRMHGGRSLRGPAHPAFRSGRYSKVLPSRLLAQYRAAEKDPELTSLRGELALVDARLADLLTRVDSGESGAIWQALLKVHGAFKRGRATGTVEGMRQALARLVSRLK